MQFSSLVHVSVAFRHHGALVSCMSIRRFGRYFEHIMCISHRIGSIGPLANNFRDGPAGTPPSNSGGPFGIFSHVIAGPNVEPQLVPLQKWHTPFCTHLVPMAHLERLALQ